MSDSKSITVKELKALSDSQTVEIVDVRTPVEFSAVHVSTAKNVPLNRLDPSKIMADRNGNTNDPLYLICKSGGRSSKACEKFAAAGFTCTVNVQGGTDSWVAAELPVERATRAGVPLHCQVQLVAGSLVTLGVGLSFYHWSWVFLSLFVGCGLIFSGLTNTCMMADVLAKMPWNQVRQDSIASSPPINPPASDLDVACEEGG